LKRNVTRKKRKLENEAEKLEDEISNLRYEMDEMHRLLGRQRDIIQDIIYETIHEELRLEKIRQIRFSSAAIDHLIPALAFILRRMGKVSDLKYPFRDLSVFGALVLLGILYSGYRMCRWILDWVHPPADFKTAHERTQGRN
jgi:predicted RNase H-like nuclease (RuvC/YqgF family)